VPDPPGARLRQRDQRVLDGAGFIFINVDLTVTLTRDPAGDWLLLEAETRTGSDGTGLARSVLSDISGVCGTGLQTLLVAPAGVRYS